MYHNKGYKSEFYALNRKVSEVSRPNHYSYDRGNSGQSVRQVMEPRQQTSTYPYHGESHQWDPGVNRCHPQHIESWRPEPNDVSSPYLDRSHDSRAMNLTLLKSKSYHFSGTDIGEYFQWEQHMDRIFESGNYPRNREHTMVASQLIGPAQSWWYQEMSKRSRYRHVPYPTWVEIKMMMRSRYAPYSYGSKQTNVVEHVHRSAETVLPTVLPFTERSTKTVHPTVLPLTVRSTETVLLTVLPCTKRSIETVHPTVLPLAHRHAEAVLPTVLPRTERSTQTVHPTVLELAHCSADTVHPAILPAVPHLAESIEPTVLPLAPRLAQTVHPTVLELSHCSADTVHPTILPNVPHLAESIEPTVLPLGPRLAETVHPTVLALSHCSAYTVCSTILPNVPHLAEPVDPIVLSSAHRSTESVLPTVLPYAHYLNNSVHLIGLPHAPRSIGSTHPTALPHVHCLTKSVDPTVLMHTHRPSVTRSLTCFISLFELGSSEHYRHPSEPDRTNAAPERIRYKPIPLDLKERLDKQSTYPTERKRPKPHGPKEKDCVSMKVLRTKPSQGGGNDEDIWPKTDQGMPTHVRNEPKAFLGQIKVSQTTHEVYFMDLEYFGQDLIQINQGLMSQDRVSMHDDRGSMHDDRGSMHDDRGGMHDDRGSMHDDRAIYVPKLAKSEVGPKSTIMSKTLSMDRPQLKPPWLVLRDVLVAETTRDMARITRWSSPSHELGLVTSKVTRPSHLKDESHVHIPIQDYPEGSSRSKALKTPPRRYGRKNACLARTSMYPDTSLSRFALWIHREHPIRLGLCSSKCGQGYAKISPWITPSLMTKTNLGQSHPSITPSPLWPKTKLGQKSSKDQAFQLCPFIVKIS